MNGSKSMKHYFKVAILLAPLAATTAQAQSDIEESYDNWVDIKDGEVSVAFNQTPIRFALEAFHAKTGFKVVLPAATESQTVNLRLERQPFEPAVRSLISTIGYQNFALVYDQEGRPSRAVVLGALPAVEVNAAPQPAVAALSLAERDQLKKDIGRWRELKAEERGRIEERLRQAPPSDDREILVREYGRQVLDIK
jgi:type II secretory pathway component GspD/PulD (secretin)